jgi:hypothetical protein
MGKRKNPYTNAATAKHCGCMNAIVGALAWALSYGRACYRIFKASVQDIRAHTKQQSLQ